MIVKLEFMLICLYFVFKNLNLAEETERYTKN